MLNSSTTTNMINLQVINRLLFLKYFTGCGLTAIILLFSLFSADATSEEYNYRVIIVSSYHESFEAERNMIKPLKLALLAKTKTQTFYLDSKRLTSNLVQENSKVLLKTIKSIAPDIVFLCDDNAIKLLIKELLLQQQKVVILGVNANPRQYVSIQLFPVLKGVLERPLYFRAILELKKFYPHATKVTILMDNTVTSNIIRKKLFADKTVHHDGITVDYKQVATFQQLKTFINQINNQPDHQLFVTTLFNLTDPKNAEKKSYDSVLNWLNRHYQKPLFSFWKTKVREHLILAAYGPSEEEQGRAAASMGNDILLGKKVAYQFVTPQNGLLYISQKQLDKFDLKIPTIYISPELTIYR